MSGPATIKRIRELEADVARLRELANDQLIAGQEDRERVAQLEKALREIGEMATGASPAAMEMSGIARATLTLEPTTRGEPCAECGGSGYVIRCDCDPLPSRCSRGCTDNTSEPINGV